MSGTSIIIENKLSGTAAENVSVRVSGNASGSSRAVSSMLETVTRGGFEAPAGDIVFSDFEVSKNPILQTVILAWDTDVATKDRSMWRIRGLSDQWKYTVLDTQFKTSHSDGTTMPCSPGAQYEFKVYGITAAGYEEWDIVRYIKISDAGAPKIVD